MEFELNKYYKVFDETNNFTGTMAKIIKIGPIKDGVKFKLTIKWLKDLKSNDPIITEKTIHWLDKEIYLDAQFSISSNAEFKPCKFEEGHSYFFYAMKEKVYVSTIYESKMKKGEFFLVDNDERIYKIHHKYNQEWIELSPDRIRSSYPWFNDGLKLFASNQNDSIYAY